MRWIIRSVDDLHADIDLVANEVVSLGRAANTGIQDRNISKLHTLLKFQPAKNNVICKQLGKHPAIINGVTVAKNMKVRIGLSSLIELLPGRHRYVITSQDSTGLKRKLSSASDSPAPKKPTLPGTNSKQTSLTGNMNTGLSSISSVSSATTGSTSTGSTISRELSSMLLSKLECQGSGGDWIVTKDLVVRNGSKGCSKIAAFDMDHTIITTKSGNVFPRDIDDWQIMWPAKVTKKLEECHNDGYKILIISNQNGIEARKITVDGLQEKVDKIVKKLNVPVQFLAAPRSTATRKPAPGMWIALEEFYNDGVPVDYSSSFYVGDAAGRLAGWDPHNKKRKDFSSSDREFARNVGIKFYTPEAFFLGQKESDTWSYKSFDAASYLQSAVSLLQDKHALSSTGQEVVLMVGYPGSGKSSFCNSHLSSYTRVNLDDMKSHGKCVSVMESSLQRGESVVVDNTFPDLATRKRYLDVAQKQGVKIRCFVMATTLEHAKHNNRYRRLLGSGQQVPGVIFNTFKSRYQEPALGEGFSDVVKVQFLPEFREQYRRELYSMFQGG